MRAIGLPPELRDGLQIFVPGANNGTSFDNLGAEGTAFVNTNSAVKTRSRYPILTNTGSSYFAGPTGFSIGSSYSINAMIYGVTGYERFISKYNGGDNDSGRGWYFQVYFPTASTGYMQMHHNSTGSGYLVNSSAFQNIYANKWNHVGVTYDGTTHKFYLNGQEISATVQSGSNQAPGTNTNSIDIGRLNFTGGPYYMSNGSKWANVMIHNKVIDGDLERTILPALRPIF